MGAAPTEDSPLRIAQVAACIRALLSIVNSDRIRARGLLCHRAAALNSYWSRVQRSDPQDDLTADSEQTEICRFRHNLSDIGARFQIASSATYAEMQDEDSGT